MKGGIKFLTAGCSYTDRKALNCDVEVFFSVF